MHGLTGGGWKRSVGHGHRRWAPGGNAGDERRDLPPHTPPASRLPYPVQSFPSHVITTPNGPVRLQGESDGAARLVPVTVDDLILAAPE